METSKLDAIRSAFNEKIPRDVISKRKAGNGMELSYLEGWYVIDLLNQIIGQGNWQYEAEDITRVYEGTSENRQGKKGRAVAYNAKVRLTLELGDEKTVTFVDVGSGKGTDFNSGLEADESAVKEAVTDGLKRCAKNLGYRMGLALYDKTQEYVGDETPVSNAQGNGGAPAATGTGKSGPVRGGSDQKDGEFNRDAVLRAIGDTARAAVASKKTSPEDLRAKLKAAFGVESKEQLSDPQAVVFLTLLKEMI